MKTTMAVALLLLTGCTNTPVRWDDDCACNSQIQAAVEFVLDASSSQDDELWTEIGTQCRRIDALEATVSALEGEDAP